MTMEEHERLAEVGDRFWTRLGGLVADSLGRMPQDLEALTMAYLSDRSSLFGTDYDKRLPTARSRHGT